MNDDLRQRFFSDILKRATFEQSKVTIYSPPLPDRLKNQQVRRYILDNDTLWRVERIEDDNVYCREATNQELADIQEGQREQA